MGLGLSKCKIDTVRVTKCITLYQKQTSSGLTEETSADQI